MAYDVTARCFLALAAALAAPGASGAEDPRLARSRDIALQFQQELSGKLMAAMSTGGPVRAIEVCRTEAPLTARSLSESTGAQVGRTALRVRNAANAADEAERAVLQDFEETLRAGVKEPPEHFEVGPDGASRYMRAIVTQPPCLTCHGTEIAPGVKEALARLYPGDEATGYAAGDLRGAFVIEWPAGPD